MFLSKKMGTFYCPISSSDSAFSQKKIGYRLVVDLIKSGLEGVSGSQVVTDSGPCLPGCFHLTTSREHSKLRKLMKEVRREKFEIFEWSLDFNFNHSPLIARANCRCLVRLS